MAQGGAHKSEGWIPQPGEVLDGRYRIEEHLDRGGMGIILRATDVVLGRDVAVKLLSPKVAKENSHRARFRREVDVIAKIKHPNVLQCYAWGETRGGVYIVTEFLDGDSLKAVIRREGRMGTRRALELTRKVLEGLSAAHAVDIVHRDIKPDNVFVTVDSKGNERVKVLDFGLAKSISAEDNKLTATGMICGTASYVAPETLVTADPGKTVDVYAVGLVLLEMLLGRQVFNGGSTSQTFMQQLVIPARIPRRIWDEPMGSVLVRALNKHPDDRYPDATEMLEALNAVASATQDFILDKSEIPPRPPDDLSGFLLDHLADVGNRTIATLRRLPRPEPYDPTEPEPDDHETVRLMVEDITSSVEHKLTLTEDNRPTLYNPVATKDTRPIASVDTEIVAAASMGMPERVPADAIDTAVDEEPFAASTRHPWTGIAVTFATIITVVVVGWFMLPADEAQPAATPAPPPAVDQVAAGEEREERAGSPRSEDAKQVPAAREDAVEDRAASGATESPAEGASESVDAAADTPSEPEEEPSDPAAEEPVMAKKSPRKVKSARPKTAPTGEPQKPKTAADELVEQYVPMP